MYGPHCTKHRRTRGRGDGAVIPPHLALLWFVWMPDVHLVAFAWHHNVVAGAGWAIRVYFCNQGVNEGFDQRGVGQLVQTMSHHHAVIQDHVLRMERPFEKRISQSPVLIIHDVRHGVVGNIDAAARQIGPVLTDLMVYSILQSLHKRNGPPKCVILLSQQRKYGRIFTSRSASTVVVADHRNGPGAILGIVKVFQRSCHGRSRVAHLVHTVHYVQRYPFSNL
mmetsp:Transcript_15439/g.29700  ORF Transcript_15439/g.29700 Transcript_15439/m.29700 type:complete len:223 (+) Transcript_15439:1921-2589(+)